MTEINKHTIKKQLKAVEKGNVTFNGLEEGTYTAQDVKNFIEIINTYQEEREGMFLIDAKLGVIEALLVLVESFYRDYKTHLEVVLIIATIFFVINVNWNISVVYLMIVIFIGFPLYVINRRQKYTLRAFTEGLYLGSKYAKELDVEVEEKS